MGIPSPCNPCCGEVLTPSSAESSSSQALVCQACSVVNRRWKLTGTVSSVPSTLACMRSDINNGTNYFVGNFTLKPAVNPLTGEIIPCTWISSEKPTYATIGFFSTCYGTTLPLVPEPNSYRFKLTLRGNQPLTQIALATFQVFYYLGNVQGTSYTGYVLPNYTGNINCVTGGTVSYRLLNGTTFTYTLGPV